MYRITFFLIFFLTGCIHVGSKSTLVEDGGPDRDVDVTHVTDAIPRFEPITKAGNSSPYRVLGKTYHVNFDNKTFRETGKASWYGKKFHGNKTSNGETYDMYAMTAAHKTLPIPCYVKVTNLENHRQVVVRVNDRGPFHPGRIIDLSYAAAKKLGIQQTGIGDVRLDIVLPAETANSAPIRSSTGEKSYLQIGAYRQHDSALALQKRVFHSVGGKVSVFRSESAGVYKVLVGPILNQSDLVGFKKKLFDEKLSDTHLVKF